MLSSRNRRRNLLLLAIFALHGCANWEPVNPVQPQQFKAGDVVEFHVRDSLVRLHGVTATRDSISGTPWLDHLTCDTCRVQYAVADISEVRTGHPGASAWVLMVPIGLVVFFLVDVAYQCRSGRCST
jgi:hypothetical protein